MNLRVPRVPALAKEASTPSPLGADGVGYETTRFSSLFGT